MNVGARTDETKDSRNSGDNDAIDNLFFSLVLHAKLIEVISVHELLRE